MCAGFALSRKTSSGPPQSHASLTRLGAWADRMSIFWERLSEVRYCLIPVESGSKYSLDGYEDLEELIRDVRDVNPKLEILGVLITRHDGRKNVCKAMKSAIERRFGEKVFRTAITSSAKIQEAEASKRTIFQHDRQSNGARDFMELGREVLARLQLHPSVSRSEEFEDQLTAASVIR